MITSDYEYKEDEKRQGDSELYNPSSTLHSLEDAQEYQDPDHDNANKYSPVELSLVNACSQSIFFLSKELYESNLVFSR